MKLRFKQIQCVPVPNTIDTQCNVFMYGLTEDGELWFKRDNDCSWNKESCESDNQDRDRVILAMRSLADQLAAKAIEPFNKGTNVELAFVASAASIQRVCRECLA